VIDPAALWLSRDAILREARFQHFAHRDYIALEMVRSARALGSMSPAQEAEAAQIEAWARPVRLDKAA
jgi:hypothetical protein